MKELCWLFLVAGFATAASVGGQAGSVPVPVSPGATDQTVGVEARCPTFSWGPVPGAISQELVLVEAEDGDLGLAEVAPLIRVDLPGTASSWTPSLDRCLQPGKLYGWSIRGVGENAPSAWSETRLFRILTPAETWGPPQIQRRWVKGRPLVEQHTVAAEDGRVGQAAAAPAGVGSGLYIEGLPVPAGQEMFTTETDCPATALCLTGVYCGNGKVVLGGGGDLTPTTTGLVVYGSYPDWANSPAQTWWFVVHNTTGTPSTFRSYAICTKLTGTP